jgi:hypothetical protein
MPEDKYFKHANINTIPTPPDEEDTTATDMISEAVEEMVENIEHTFAGYSDDKKDT